MLPTVAVAVTLFYLCAVPVHIAFRLCLDADSRFSLGVSLFEPRFARRRPLHKKLRFSLPRPSFQLNTADILPAARCALRHFKPDRFQLEGVFATGDAAVTALVCGSVSALGQTLECIDGSKFHIRLFPDFTAGRFRAEIAGMISVRIGHIMTAALFGAIQYGSRRLKKWINTPSKAS